MKKAYIYILICPETQQVRYVGKTTQEKHRFQNHLSDKTHTHRGSWIRSLRKKNLRPDFCIIEECTVEDWNQLEIYWISQFKAWGFKLTNHTEGGEGAIGAIRSIDFRSKVSKSLKGRKKPVDFKTSTQKLSVLDIEKIKAMMCEGKTNKEIFNQLSELPLVPKMLMDIRAGRTWSKIKGPCGHFH